MGDIEKDVTSALGLTRQELRDLVAGMGAEPFRGDQVFEWIHARGVLDPASMTNLPRPMRDVLAARIDLSAPLVRDLEESDDGTVKLSLVLDDGYSIESVIITSDQVEGAAGPSTLCVSTQVGCRVRCSFCRSGRHGFRRNLSAAEIVGQVTAARHGRGRDDVGRVVFMGIGEPLDNYDALARAIRILSDDRGHGLALRRLVVSTVGRPEAMARLARDFDGRVGLAVSLHSADPATRRRLIGSRSVAGPEEVVRAARAYPLAPRERVTVEVVLVRSVNDSPDQARLLASALERMRARVNLIPVNPFEGLELEPPDERVVGDYQRVLAGRGLPVFVRRRRGARILASCGQLAFGSGRGPGR